ncbi:MAG TPA: hypothetical protein VFH47_07255, partial [Candidatus Thermoplasmatota archaeon]|nr:hypothetical protein [Candidatus Thermoplasmatota archaeon]
MHANGFAPPTGIPPSGGGYEVEAEATLAFSASGFASVPAVGSVLPLAATTFLYWGDGASTPVQFRVTDVSDAVEHDIIL